MQLYALCTARADVEVGVFWDLQDAEQWLDESNAPRSRQ